MENGKINNQTYLPYSRASNTNEVCGVSVLRDPLLSKGQGFTIEERQKLGIHGLLPPAVRTLKDQEQIVLANLENLEPLQKYTYLISLQDRNEKLFYHVVTKNVEKMMPIIYTPTVGLACQNYSLIHQKPRGLFISIHDKGHIYDVLGNWPVKDVKAIVVTDGERILGLGDLGSNGMGIPVGKLSLYTACAGVKPDQCLPITLDVGTNNEKILNDPFYFGLKQKRVDSTTYDDFMEEFMKSCVQRFGQNVLIQFEDFGNHNAFKLLAKYRDNYCTFNDDIQGTASVTTAGLIASLYITQNKMSDQKFLFQGAGEAAIGIANLLCLLMLEEGLTEKEAFSRIYMVDSKGLIVKDRPKGGITEHKAPFAQDMDPIDHLEDVVKCIKPTAIIGVAAVAGAFTKNIIKDMASFNERPIIFALSNPTSKAECTAEEAYSITGGKCIFASGSPFDPVTIDGVTHYPGQGNNAYIFPGVGLAAVLCGMKYIPETIFLKAAKVLANEVSTNDLNEGRVYPHLQKIQDVSLKIAIELCTFAFQNNLASVYPEPVDMTYFVKSQLYNCEYENSAPLTWEWPSQHTSKI